MCYLNFKNPNDRVVSDWVQIVGKDTEKKRYEFVFGEEFRDVWDVIINEGYKIDAGKLHQEILNSGATVSFDQTMTPNGVVVSSAGILVALDSEDEIEIVKSVIRDIKNNPKKYTKNKMAWNTKNGKGGDDVELDVQ